MIVIASRLMHYYIAIQILKEISLDKNLFILGNLAPDAHDGTARGNFRSHFRRINGDDYDEFPNIDLERFKMKYMTGKIDSFTVGYYCHLIADSTWVNATYPEYLQFGSGVDHSTQRQLCFRDFGILNMLLTDRFDLCFDDIMVPAQLDIEEFQYERLESILTSLKSDLTRRYEDTELRIFNIDFITAFLDNAIEHCIAEVKHLSMQNHNQTLL